MPTELLPWVVTLLPASVTTPLLFAAPLSTSTAPITDPPPAPLPPSETEPAMEPPDAAIENPPLPPPPPMLCAKIPSEKSPAVDMLCSPLLMVTAPELPPEPPSPPMATPALKPPESAPATLKPPLPPPPPTLCASRPVAF
jgi:hypothetical protein